jgi:glycosyltransferase involved in cell wall biosynthesis
MPQTILIAATHPLQCTGYARVGHTLANGLAERGWNVVYWGYQNLTPSSGRAMHPNVRVIDVGQRVGDGWSFGQHLFQACVDDTRPDVVLLYNDVMILNSFLDVLPSSRPYRLVCYVDMVHPNEHPGLVEGVVRRSDSVWVFADRWKADLLTRVPEADVHVLPHGMDEAMCRAVEEPMLPSIEEEVTARGGIELGTSRDPSDQGQPYTQPQNKGATAREGIELGTSRDPSDQGQPYTQPQNKGATSREPSDHTNEGATARGGIEPGTSREPLSKEAAKARVGIDPETFLVVNTNRNSYRKCLDLTIDGFLRFWKTHPNATLMLNNVANTDSGYDIPHVIETSARSLDMLDRMPEIMSRGIVGLPGGGFLKDEEVATMYRAADVCVNTCNGEGFGLCALEGACLGTPQIATDTGGLRDILGQHTREHKDAHRLLEPVVQIQLPRGFVMHGGLLDIVHPDAVRQALEDVASDPMAADKAEAAARTLRTTFQWSTILDKANTLLGA